MFAIILYYIGLKILVVGTIEIRTVGETSEEWLYAVLYTWSYYIHTCTNGYRVYSSKNNKNGKWVIFYHTKRLLSSTRSLTHSLYLILSLDRADAVIIIYTYHIISILSAWKIIFSIMYYMMRKCFGKIV